MKKSLLHLAAASVVAMILSCSREAESLQPVSDPVPDTAVTVDPSDPANIDIYSTRTYSQEDYVNFIGESFDDYLGDFLSTDLNALVKRQVGKIFDERSSAVDEVVAKELGCLKCKANSKWSVKVINYAYLTLSYTGEPIRLSAALCVPVLNDNDSRHTLSALSLCPPHMPIDKEYCATMNGTILMTRVAFNHAVVVPDYQGRGITSSKPYSSLHTHDHAIQAIHAALAARTILEKEGYLFDKDFGTYNIGVSEGGETSYEVQKIIENDIAAEQRNILNLKLSFCANGIAQHSKYIATQMGIYEYTSDESFVLQMNFYADAFDCLSESEKQGFTRADFYSHSLIGSNNRIIVDSPVIKVLQDAVARNDIPYNWNPQHPISIAGSVDDNDVLYKENALYVYNLLKNHPGGGKNSNVSLLTFNTPISAKVSDFLGPDYMFAHIAADVCCFVHAVRYENPGAHPIITSISTLEQIK